MTYAGFYINLDRSPERRREMEAQFARHGLGDRYRRFAAADGNGLNFPDGGLLPGEMGCFISHYTLLKENLGSDTPLHIVEDDVQFSRHTAEAIQSLIAGNAFANHDIIYTDVQVPVSNVIYKKYKDLYDQSVLRDGAGNISRLNLNIVALKNIGFAATASMIMGPAAIRKLHDLYAAELEKGAATPIDLFIRRKAEEGVLKVGCIFPFVTSVRLDHVLGTTMEDRDSRLVALAATIARKTFFVECDWDECRDYALGHLQLPKDDVHLQILTHVLAFSFGKMFDFP